MFDFIPRDSPPKSWYARALNCIVFLMVAWLLWFTIIDRRDMSKRHFDIKHPDFKALYDPNHK